MSSPCLLFFFSILLCLFFLPQERSPHGLVYESPVAFSPEAYSFFHPETQKQNSTTTESLCDNNNSTSESSGSSTFPTASSLQSNLAHESLSKPDEDGDKRMGAGGMVGIALGFGFAIVLACGVYYAVIARKRSAGQGVPVQLNV
ncbi:uncharacterized protein LOC132600297 [Lycium barbarum]|uniref:uncharacterized protein LOC132600297 n=1 Tax=Lycium barbarum TaxID=112863 RepID=UPI00293EC5E9|nr:uncharacterized protein LOC132600297 [Lycium barbarum]